jgi:hypothetical protein
MAATPNELVPILSKHLKGYVIDGRQLGIASNKFPGGPAVSINLQRLK